MALRRGAAGKRRRESRAMAAATTAAAAAAAAAAATASTASANSGSAAAAAASSASTPGLPPPASQDGDAQQQQGAALDQPAELRALLGNMLDDPQLSSLCDVVMVVGGARFPAHKAVLASASKVFKAMFTNCMKERDASEIVLGAVDARSWRMALQYIYTAQVAIEDVESAVVLLGSARMYQLERLEKFVEKFLVSRLKVCNVFDMLAHADLYDLEELQRACRATMEERFEDVSQTPGFGCCEVDTIDELLQSSDLVLRSEMAVFEAIVRWIGRGEKVRVKELERLLRHVELGSLNEYELKAVARHPLASQCTPFRDAALERVLYCAQNTCGEKTLATGGHLKPRRRSSHVFTFSQMQRGITLVSPADDEEVVRTAWQTDGSGRHIWRLKIYPRGYHKAKGQYLSMYVQARSAYVSEKLDLLAKFDIFLTNRNDSSATVLFSSQHRFTETNDHWGFHRFLPLVQLTNPTAGFLDVETDSVLLGANVYFP